MKTEIFVQTGQVCSARGKKILRSTAIGSCVAVAALAAETEVGAMAHIMLAGACPAQKEENKTAYAQDAIHELTAQLEREGAKIENIIVCVIGGSDVLRKNDRIGEINVKSVLRILESLNISVAAKSVGGYNRRSATIDIQKKTVTFSVGKGAEQVLWQL